VWEKDLAGDDLIGRRGSSCAELAGTKELNAPRVREHIREKVAGREGGGASSGGSGKALRSGVGGHRPAVEGGALASGTK
jgi:hypothetical protein